MGLWDLLSLPFRLAWSLLKLLAVLLVIPAVVVVGAHFLLSPGGFALAVGAAAAYTVIVFRILSRIYGFAAQGAMRAVARDTVRSHRSKKGGAR